VSITTAEIISFERAELCCSLLNYGYPTQYSVGLMTKNAINTTT